MNILYISSTHAGMHSKSIYYDLAQKFVEHGHTVHIAYAREQRIDEETSLYFEHNIEYLGIRTQDLTKTRNFIKKGIATVTIDYYFNKAFKKYYKNHHFDLILYSTPPITLIQSLKTLKKMNPDAMLYLMLKDIFPQNAIDVGIMSKFNPMYFVFKRMEATLYNIFDYIGVMSPQNMKYLISQEPHLKDKVEVLPNTISLDLEQKNMTRDRSYFGFKDDDLILFFGGNLGKPQAIPFMIECAQKLKLENVKIVVAGSGSDQHLVEAFSQKHPETMMYFGHLPKNDYDSLVAMCDVGLIFLDYRFTIPNYPQRILSYMEQGIPVLCATDAVTDIGTDAQNRGYGLTVPSNDADQWVNAVKFYKENPEARVAMGEKGYEVLKNMYLTDYSYDIIMNRYKKVKGV